MTPGTVGCNEQSLNKQERRALTSGAGERRTEVTSPRVKNDKLNVDEYDENHFLSPRFLNAIPYVKWHCCIKYTFIHELIKKYCYG